MTGACYFSATSYHSDSVGLHNIVVSVAGSPWQVAVMSGGLGGGGTPKMSVIGEAVRLVPVDQITSFQISALGFLREDVHANVISKFYYAIYVFKTFFISFRL